MLFVNSQSERPSKSNPGLANALYVPLNVYLPWYRASKKH